MKSEQIQNIIFGSFSFMASQELAWLYNILEKSKVKNILEIGVAYGASLMIWEKLGGFIVGIDNDIQSKAYGMLTHLIEARKMKIKLILGNSEDPEIIKKAKDYFLDRTVDFLFIDGEHSYEVVKQDYLNYGPMVKSGGIIAFHDTIHPRTTVKQFWEELKENRDLQIEEFNDNSGIGVIHVEK